MSRPIVDEPIDSDSQMLYGFHIKNGSLKGNACLFFTNRKVHLTTQQQSEFENYLKAIKKRASLGDMEE